MRGARSLRRRNRFRFGLFRAGGQISEGTNNRGYIRRKGAVAATRALCLSLFLALVAGVVGAAPATADEVIDWDEYGTVTDHLPATDRGRVVELWKTGGPGVKAAAEVALMGSDADVKEFLGHEKDIAQLSDDRVATVQIFSAGGRGVREAAQKALAGTPRTCAPSSRTAGRPRSNRTSGSRSRRSSPPVAPV